MALGGSATGVSASDVALGSEITTNGGQRKGGSDVTVTLITTTVAEDTLQFQCVWAFTGISGSLAVNEFGVFNGATPGSGDPPAGSRMLLRQVFGSTFYAETGHTLELKVKVIASAPDNDTSVGTDNPGQVITNAGLVEGNKLIAADLTPAQGRFSHVELGTDDGTTLPLLASNTALGAAITDSGLARVAATVTQQTTNVAGDTTQWFASWTATATKAIREVGLFNAASGGTMFLRHIMGRPWNVVATDVVEMNVKAVNVP